MAIFRILTFYEPDFGKPIFDGFHIFFFGPYRRGRCTPASLNALATHQHFSPTKLPTPEAAGASWGKNAASLRLSRYPVNLLPDDFGSASCFELAASLAGREPKRWLATTFYPCRRFRQLSPRGSPST
jgi:hypothetical protein